jgi:ABC-type enterochelin transport system substrate-binding protein
MPRLVLLLILALAACSSNDTATSDSSTPVSMQDWRTERGKVPTEAEFTAVLASCQDRAKTAVGDLDSCLTDMGLQKSQ